MQSGDWPTAEQRLERAVKACPVDPEARRLYAESLWQLGDADNATQQLREAVRITPLDSGLRLRLAEMALAQNDFSAAMREVDEAIELDPNSAAAWSMRAQLMQRLGRQSQALADYYRALRSDPRNPTILLRVAELHRESEQPRRALVTLQEVAELYPPGSEPPEVFYLQGLSYRAMDRPREAAIAFSLAVERGSTSPDTYYHLAEASLMNGDLDRAHQVLGQALLLSPDHHGCQNLLRQVEVAQHNGRIRFQ